MSPTSCIPDYFDSVQPILKKPGQDLSILNNYQPISKLPFISKILDKVVEGNNLLDKFQFEMLLHRNSAA